MLVKDQFHYPSVRDVLRVSVKPSMSTAAAK